MEAEAAVTHQTPMAPEVFVGPRRTGPQPFDPQCVLAQHLAFERSSGLLAELIN